jgi:hypothetical protein
VSQIGRLSGPIICQKNIKFETFPQIEWGEVIFFETPYVSGGDIGSYHVFHTQGMA